MRGAGGLASLAALLACAPRLAPAELSAALEGCPASLGDEALRDLALYDLCALPEPLQALVRNDYADDELEAGVPAALAALAGQVPREKFEYQLRTFVDPEGALEGWYAVEAGAVLPDPVLFPALEVPFARGPGTVGAKGPRTLQAPVAEERAFRAERQAELRRAADGAAPLAGLRVLVDPGHLGGRYAAFEKRRFEWRAGAGPAAVIPEGELTLKTARELAAKLASAGARVELTREGTEPGPGSDLAALRPFADRLLRHLALDPAFSRARAALPPRSRAALDVAAALFAVRKQFVFEILRDRMRRAARFEPDLIVSLHYNAGPWSGARAGPQALVAMVRGNYQAGRLYHPGYRARALADAFDIDEFNASAHLGAACLRGMSRALDLPVAREDPSPDHAPIRGALGEQSGVAAWNGAVLRYATAPAVLLEGPLMNERGEIPRLRAALDAPIGAEGTRTERYAEGVARGIEAWTRRWLAQEHNDFGPDL